MMSNPFKPADKVARRIKVLVFGLPGTGKTRCALTFPRVAVIDTEGGTDLYSGREGVPHFDVMRAKTLDEVNAAIAFIQKDNGRTFDTLVIDSITVLYDVQKDAAAKATKTGEMEMRAWNKVNGRMNGLYITLMNLPVHVVVVAQEAELFEGEGMNLKRTGNKPDADKKVMRPFDFVVRLRKDHSGEIIKSRGVGLAKEIPAVNWDVFAQAAGMFSEGESVPLQQDDEAVKRDTASYQDKPQAPVWADELTRLLSNERVDEESIKRAKGHVWKLFLKGVLTNDTPIDEVFNAAVSIFHPDELLESGETDE